MNKKQTGLMLAALAGALFTTGVFAAQNATADEATVKCSGANACKGQSACKSATSACKGQNSCKGKGFVMTKTNEECTSKGGTVSK